MCSGARSVEPVLDRLVAPPSLRLQTCRLDGQLAGSRISDTTRVVGRLGINPIEHLSRSRRLGTDGLDNRDQKALSKTASCRLRSITHLRNWQRFPTLKGPRYQLSNVQHLLPQSNREAPYP